MTALDIELIFLYRKDKEAKIKPTPHNDGSPIQSIGIDFRKLIPIENGIN